MKICHIMEGQASMSRQPLNNSFLQTSFLHGTNVAYIEEMHSLYERNPGSVSDEWRHFFANLQEEQGQDSLEAAGASWAVPLEQLCDVGDNGELIAALSVPSHPPQFTNI